MRYIDWVRRQIKFLKMSNVIRFPIEKRIEQIEKEKRTNPRGRSRRP